MVKPHQCFKKCIIYDTYLDALVVLFLPKKDLLAEVVTFEVNIGLFELLFPNKPPNFPLSELALDACFPFVEDGLADSIIDDILKFSKSSNAFSRSAKNATSPVSSKIK